MSKNQIQDGKYMAYVASAAISSGAPVAVGGRVGVAVADIANGESGTLCMEGVFNLSKEAEAIAQGVAVYLKSNGKVTATASGNTACGYAFEGAGSSDATMAVKLNG